MLLDFIVDHSLGLTVVFGLFFALLGLYKRKPGQSGERKARVLVDGLQGATIASLALVAYLVAYLGDARALQALKDQSSFVAIYSALGTVYFVVEFWDSLK